MTGRFLLSPEHKEFLRRYGAQSLAEIHRSLANEDRIGAIIRKERLLHFPLGTGLKGALYIPSIYYAYAD
jgi:hypothetical protein